MKGTIAIDGQKKSSGGFPLIFPVAKYTAHRMQVSQAAEFNSKSEATNAPRDNGARIASIEAHGGGYMNGKSPVERG
jgi:hypothetical protein